MALLSGTDALIADFRAEFHDACALAGSDLAARWDDWWTSTVRRAADDILRSGGSASAAVRQRLERAADYYRRMLCDPACLYASSLVVQQTVTSHLARMDARCEEDREGSSALTAVVPGAGLSPEWLRYLRGGPAVHALLDGWPVVDAAEQQHPRWWYRPPCNLYGNPHAGVPWREVVTFDSRTLLTVGVAEAHRRLEREECEDRPPPWVDVETVAARHCGYAFVSGPWAAWRAPLAVAERRLLRMLSDGDRPRFVDGVLDRWLRERCNCDAAAWRGVRWPPSCTAALADAIVSALVDFHGAEVVEGGIVVIPMSSPGPELDPRIEPFSVWTLAGASLRPPDVDRLTRGWTDADRAVLLDRCDGRLGPELRAAWAERFAAEE